MHGIPLFKDPLRKEIEKLLKEQVSSFFQMEWTQEECVLETPPNPKMGQLAFPCFQLGRKLKKNPNEIAKNLAQSWTCGRVIKKVQPQGAYLNFFLQETFLGSNLFHKISTGSYFNLNLKTDSSSPYLVEYSQPNTHKELHVGHMRNLCLGQSLVLLLKYFGLNVVSCTFPGDVGTHVAKCLWYLKNHNKDPLPSTNQGQWLGQLYSKAHNQLEKDRDSPKEEENQKQLTEILHQISQKKGEFFQLWESTRQWSMDLMKEIYNWAGVSFDRWYWESEVDQDSIELVKKLYEKGQLTKNEGALGLDLSQEGLGFVLFLKSDGNGLYSTKDLQLACQKFKDYKPKESIVIVDMRQELHFKQVFTSFEKLGLGPSKPCRHVKYNFVELPDGPMSSRKGNIIPIMDLIEKMKNQILNQYLNRYKKQWTDEDIETTAHQIAQGAIKYGMNRMEPNKKIVFDMNEWLRLDGESGPYIQYAHARMSSLLNKEGVQGWTYEKPNSEEATERGVRKKQSPQKAVTEDTDAEDLDWSQIQEESEKNLLFHLSLFNEVLYKSLRHYKTSGICNYTFELAQLFNRFYHDCPIGSLHNKKVKKNRIALVQMSQKVLAKGLELLGIPAPHRM